MEFTDLVLQTPESGRLPLQVIQFNQQGPGGTADTESKFTTNVRCDENVVDTSKPASKMESASPTKALVPGEVSPHVYP